MSKKRTSKSGRREGGKRHSRQYTQCNTFHVLCFVFLFSLSQVHAQTQAPAEAQLESDLPDEVIAEIIDTTRIVLEPRERFSDPLKPQLIRAIGLYPKERLWHLPPAVTPQKAVKPTPLPPKNYRLHLTAYPSLPESLFYEVFFAGRMEKTRGFLHLARQQLGNAQTKERGNYDLDRVRGGFTHRYQELSELSFNLGLNLKALQWLPSTTEKPNLQKDLLLFRSDLSWQQQVSKTTWSAVNLDTTLLRTDLDESALRTEAADLRLNFDMAFSWPFLNPIHAGSKVEYFSAGNTAAVITRLYARDEFTPFGPFVCSIGLEGVSLREPDDVVRDKGNPQSEMTGDTEQADTEASEDNINLPLYPSLALTTHLDKHWLIQLEGARTITRHRLSTLYFDTDYISFNPLLRPEKAWNGQITLKHHQGAKFEANLSGFARQIGDLVVLTPQTEPPEENSVPSTDNTATALAWTPMNIEASIYGAELLVSACIANLLDLRFQYTHEVSIPVTGEQIPYRAADRIDVEATYRLPSEFHVTLKAELRGPRYVDTMTDEILTGYLLLRPKLSKTVGGYVDAFVSGAFAVGEYQLLEMYELSQRNFDFGIELKF